MARLEGRERVIAELSGNSDKLCRGVLLETHKRVMQKTPVRSGRARANWNVSVGAPDTSINNDATSADVGAKQAEALSVVGQFKAGDTGYVTNSLPYIPELEDGRSKQAPGGMIKVTVAEMQPVVDRISASIKVHGE